MLIVDLKNYIENRQQVSLVEISHHFHIPTSMAENMLQIWIDKNLIEKKQATIEELPNCTKTSECPLCQLSTKPESLTMFTFIGKH